VHRLLGDYIAAEFIEASEYKGTTPHLREALRALAREADRPRSNTPKQSLDTRPSQPNSVADGASRNDQDQHIGQITDSIRRSQRFGSNRSMLQFANEVGLRVVARPKESRERLAKRVAEAISLVPEPRRSQMLAQLTGNGDRQTQGWIDVIKSPRP